MRGQARVAREAKPEELVASWVDALLRSRGWTVITIERRVRRCPHCGKVPTDVVEGTDRRGRYRDGVSKMAPDRLYFHPEWCDTGCPVAVEFKAAGGRWSSDEQKAAHDAGVSILIRGSKRKHGMVTTHGRPGALAAGAKRLVWDLREIVEVSNGA